MPRHKTLSDADVLETAHRLIHEHGPDALTFARLARECGLSASTLVQRFANKAGLVRSALLHAWDRLDEKTERLAATTPTTPEGAVAMLVALSGDYGDIEAYADGLLVLREDLRDPVLRARGAAWKAALCRALEDRFARVPSAPPDIGLLIASQWQGSLLWWSFDPQGSVDRFAEQSLKRFVAVVVGSGSDPAQPSRRASRTT